MRRADEPDIIELWKETASAEPDATWRNAFASLATTFSDLADRGALWREALEGWNMRESPFIDEVKAVGRVEGQRESLLRMLRSKFGAAVPAEVVHAIEAQSDPVILDDWIDRAVVAGSIESIRGFLGAA